MNIFTTFLQAEWAERAGWTLLHSLWQIAAVAAALCDRRIFVAESFGDSGIRCCSDGRIASGPSSPIDGSTNRRVRFRRCGNVVPDADAVIRRGTYRELCSGLGECGSASQHEPNAINAGAVEEAGGRGEPLPTLKVRVLDKDRQPVPGRPVLLSDRYHRAGARELRAGVSGEPMRTDGPTWVCCLRTTFTCRSIGGPHRCATGKRVISVKPMR